MKPDQQYFEPRTTRSRLQIVIFAILAAVMTSSGSFAQQQTGLQPYYRTSNPNGQAPPGNGWTPLPTAGVPVTLQPGKSVWIGAANRENPDNTKTFQALVHVGLGVTAYTSCTVKGVKTDGSASTTSTIDIKPYYYWWNVKATFTPQPAWEHIRIRNTSNQSVVISSLRIDRISSWCKKTESTGGSNDERSARMRFSDASFGAAGAMFNDTRVTQLTLFPRNVSIDENQLPSFSAPPETGNWTHEFVYVDPDNEPRPRGGVRFVADGPGLEAGQEFDMAVSMLGLADNHYDLFAYDEDANSFQRIYVREPGLPWWDSFHDDPPDIGVHGRRGWQGWDDRRAVDAVTSDVQARSETTSLLVEDRADIVHPFDGADCGRWALSAWQYIPGDFTSGGSGQFTGTHFILLNTYEPGGEYNWSVDLQFDSNSQMLKVYHGDGFNTIDVPYETDRWVKIQVLIDTDDDWTRIYYDDSLVAEYQWTGGVFGEGGGALDVAAVDLWANRSSGVYYDDLKLEPLPEPGERVDMTDFHILEGTHIDGGLPELVQSDDQYLKIEAKVTGIVAEPHLIETVFEGTAPMETPGMVFALVESRITDISAATSLSIRDWNTGELVGIAQFTTGLEESVFRTEVPVDGLYVRPGDRRMEFAMKQINFMPFTLNGYHLLLDRLRIAVE